jgi:hypothetical protein
MLPYMWHGTCGFKVSRDVIHEFLGVTSYFLKIKQKNQKKKKEKILNTSFAWDGSATWAV